MATAYVTAAQMVTRYGKRLQQALSGADGTVANADSVLANDRLLQAIEYGNATVDLYVIGKHSPADVSSNPALSKCAGVIAYHNLLESYRTEMVEPHVPALERSMAMLKDIAKGLAGGGLVTLTFEPENRTQMLATPVAVEISSEVTAAEGNPTAAGQVWFERGF